MIRALSLSGLLLMVFGVSGGFEVAASAPGQSVPPDKGAFSFFSLADVRLYSGPGAYDSCEFFRGAMGAMTAVGPGDFLITPGDIDPLDSVAWTIRDTLGEDFAWFPVVGNHELPDFGQEAYSGANMEWLRAYDYAAQAEFGAARIVRWGPPACATTTYSFDSGAAHFAVINEYCDESGDTATLGDIPDYLYNWLAADLAATCQPFIFVVGHEPAYPLPDAANGRVRHIGDSLDQHPRNRDRFWSLLRGMGVTAYFCGHTHNYSAVDIGGVWQIDVGHARGRGDPGAQSTFVKVQGNAAGVVFATYRSAPETPCVYRETQRWEVLPNRPDRHVRAVWRCGELSAAF